MSGRDIRVVVYALTAIVGAILVLDRLGELLVTDYETTESTIVGIIAGAITALAVGRSIWRDR